MSVKIKRLGHSTILVETASGLKFIFDSWLESNPNAVYDEADLEGLDAILVTHGGFDHLGDAVPLAKRTGAHIFCGGDVMDYALYHGIPREQITPMVWGSCSPYRGIQIHSIEAKHISSLMVGEHKITGIPMSFIVNLEDGTGLYFAGDTAIYSDMALYGRLYGPVNIGFFCMYNLDGYPYEMTAKEAAMAANLFDVEVAIPIHYPRGNTEYPPEFCRELSAHAPRARALILEAGESAEL